MPQKTLWKHLALSVLALLAACSKPEPEKVELRGPDRAEVGAAPVSAPSPGVDYHSFANTDDYRTTHIDLDFTVDFERKVLQGEARLHLQRLNEANDLLVLDTRELAIESVRAGSGDRLAAAPFSIGDASDDLGAPLSIEMPADATEVVIRYTTSPDALALQWLEPQQTEGKRSTRAASSRCRTHRACVSPTRQRCARPRNCGP